MQCFIELTSFCYNGELSGGPWQLGLDVNRLGHWQLMRELGKGGMGSVWLAERVDKELNMNVDLMRKNEVEPGIFDCNPEQPVEIGTQLHRGDRFCAIISIHATEAAQQNHTYTGSLWIDLIQWNFSGQQPQSAPQVAANNAVVTVTEGSGASNAGTFSNSGPGIVTEPVNRQTGPTKTPAPTPTPTPTPAPIAAIPDGLQEPPVQEGIPSGTIAFYYRTSFSSHVANGKTPPQ